MNAADTGWYLFCLVIKAPDTHRAPREAPRSDWDPVPWASTATLFPNKGGGKASPTLAKGLVAMACQHSYESSRQEAGSPIH